MTGPPHPIRPLAVVGGLIIGTVGWVVFLLTTVNLLGGYLNISYQSAGVIASLGWAAIAAALLAHPNTRQAGAGLLLGVAVSVIVWAGACMVMLGVD